MSVVYVLTTPIPKDDDDATVKELKKTDKWDNDDYVGRGLILNGMSDSLFDIYQSVESSKEPWDSLKARNMAEDASSKKFFVSNITNYKMTDSTQVMEQHNELLSILGSRSLDHPCCGVLPSCLSAVILSLIMSLKCEHGVVN
nr:zinc finger, CCHC-type [Tanacetum cinerariifolium]